MNAKKTFISIGIIGSMAAGALYSAQVQHRSRATPEALEPSPVSSRPTFNANESSPRPSKQQLAQRLQTLSPPTSAPLPEPLATLARDADLIAIGTAGTPQAQWNTARTLIYTSIPLQVEEYLRGSGPVTLIEPGGTVGDTTLQLHDAGIPEFDEGEKVLVFLKRGTPRLIGPVKESFTASVMSGYLGKYNLSADDAGVVAAVNLHPETGKEEMRVRLSDLRAALKKSP